MFCLSANTLVAQAIKTEFGKNRVQHHQDFKNWLSYETENFIVYWYGKGKNIAQSVIQMAEMDHDEIQNIMEHRFNNKIEIVVYLDVTDMKQSNIGVESVFENETGQTKIVGNKMFVYFDGNHQNLRTKIREGVASVYLNSMLFGSNLQEIVQNAVLLNVPPWYKKGLSSYIGSYWDFEKEDELRDLFAQDKKHFIFENLAEDYPEIAGHSLWYYIDQNYGKSAISNILYLTRINRNLESSFLYVLGTNFDIVLEEWQEYYRAYFQAEHNVFEEENNELDLSNKKHQPISQVQLSPDGRSLIYVYNDLGKYWVKQYDFKTEKEKLLFKHGYKNSFQETDYNYPLITWHSESKEISILYEDKDILKLRKIALDSKEHNEQIIPEMYQRIYSIDYASDHDYVFSAAVRGHSDLFYYKSKTRETDRITEDFYNDLDAKVITSNGEKGILFVSNRSDNRIYEQRLDTILPLDKFDIFYYPLSANEKTLQRITFTPEINERYPVIGDQNKITFINHKSGIANRFTKTIENENNGIPNSNKNRNIIRHDTKANAGVYVSTYYLDGAYRCFLEYPEWSNAKTQHQSPIGKAMADFYNPPSPILLPVEVIPEIKQELNEVFKFQSEFDDPTDLEAIEVTKVKKNAPSAFLTNPGFNDSDKTVIKYNSARALAARMRFRLDNFTTKMDNDVLFNGLESYAGEDKTLNQNPLGILLKANVIDLFEDHSIEGGVRIPTTFNGSEYFLVYENRKKRIDKTFALYRRSTSNNLDETQIPIERIKRVSYIGMFQAKYPFDVYRSLRLTSQLRFDRLYYFATEQNTFFQPVVNEKRLSLKAEYVFDNTREVDINILNGTRYKIFAEGINKYELDFVDGFDFELSNGFTSVFGFDARHYVPLGKHSILAFRAAAAASMGSEKMLYYLGGTENWILPSFNENTPVNNDKSFAYKALAPQMRGFKNNIRNGGSYALMNAELRVPIFKYLRKKRIGSAFIRNFQFVFFYDVGSAWYGLSPYSDENPLNTLTIQNSPVVNIKVKYFRDPLVMGFGPGVRTTLFGYFLKLDYGWGLETRTIQKPILFFSFGKDF